MSGPVFLGKLIAKRKNKEYIPWEERTSSLDEEMLEDKKRANKKGERPLTWKNGALCAAEEEEGNKQFWGSFKAEKMMR